MQSNFFSSSRFCGQSIQDIAKSIDHISQRLLIRAVVIVIISAVLMSASPLFMAKVINAVTAEDQAQNQAVVLYAMFYLILRFGGQGLVDLRWIVVNPVLYAISYSLCVNTASRLSNVFRHEGRNGDNAATIAKQVTVIAKMELGSISLLYGILAIIVPTIIELLIVCFAVGIALGPWLAVYMICGGIFFITAVSFKRKKELLSAAAAHEADSVVSASFAEYISNPSLVREFGADNFMKTRLAKTIGASLHQHRQLFSIKTERGLYLTAIAGAVYAAVLLGSIYNGRAETIGAGGLFLLVVYLDRILQPLTNASAAINSIQNGVVAMKSAYALIDELEKKAASIPFSIEKKRRWENIVMVSKPHFSLSDQTLRIGKGTWIRLHGPSGSGKSTCLRRIYHKLISGIVYPGVDIHYLNPVPVVIRGSVFDNIALGDDSVTRAHTQRYWTEWHQRWGNRQIDLDTDVEQLSAGETQFLAICRTLVRNPKLVIFDEATNSIDVQSEGQLWELIRELLPTATAFVVSHRDINTILFDHEEFLS